MKRKIGKTGMEVFPIGLGAMPLSIQGRPDEKQAIAVVHAALDAGVDFIDTADVYCLDDSDIGHNEALITRALESRGALGRTTVATKGGLRRPGGDWVTRAAPADLRKACEHSLKMLKTDSIALYQLHAPDERVPFEDSVGELARLQKEGKIRHVGLSNVSEAQLRSALGICAIVSVQNRCNAFDQRDFKNGLVAACASLGVAYIPYSPVGGHYQHSKLAQNAQVTGIARRLQASTYQVLLAWLLRKGEHVLPIPGASRVASITDSAGAPKIAPALTASDIAAIDSLS